MVDSSEDPAGAVARGGWRPAPYRPTLREGEGKVSANEGSGRVTLRAGVAAVALALVLAACGGGAEITVTLQEVGAGGSFGLVNRSPAGWSDVRVRVTGDSGGGPCYDQVVSGWAPGELRTLPRCGERTLVSIEVGGQQAELVYANGKLYRKLGRREIPVPGN
jgi:hypothetical protein